MKKKECIAMLLAGGKGTRLGSLTSDIAKPAVYFGGKYRIIDFTLSNCTNSGIDTLGVLTQYHSQKLKSYIKNGKAWNLDKTGGGVLLLPSSKHGKKYTGTANAVYQNIKFIEQFNPENVLILSSDHIYKMNYQKMLDFHKRQGADATISAVKVPRKEASNFGVIKADNNGVMTDFTEKPANPKSDFVSMGIYIFKWSLLKKYLLADKDESSSNHDFGKNIIPSMLSSKKRICVYQFDGYWKDVGTIQSLWESNMDLCKDSPEFNLNDKDWIVYTKQNCHSSFHISNKSNIKTSFVGEGCHIQGKLNHSILFHSTFVGEGVEINDSIIMPNVYIHKNAKINKAIIGANTTIGENVEIGVDEGSHMFIDHIICSKNISLIAPGTYISRNLKFKENSHINRSLMSSMYI